MTHSDFSLCFVHIIHHFCFWIFMENMPLHCFSAVTFLCNYDTLKIGDHGVWNKIILWEGEQVERPAFNVVNVPVTWWRPLWRFPSLAVLVPSCSRDRDQAQRRKLIEKLMFPLASRGHCFKVVIGKMSTVDKTFCLEVLFMVLVGDFFIHTFWYFPMFFKKSVIFIDYV